MKDWMRFKYDLCENEIQCDGRTIAYADNSILDIADKDEFKAAVQKLGFRLGWLVTRANLASEMLIACEGALSALLLAPHVDKHQAINYLREVIAKANNKPVESVKSCEGETK